ncbi:PLASMODESMATA CALLOSE-BINDING PROTEIN [Salix suchowensis]|nr:PLASMODESMATA CALLOSE-BINDING PROTEIN [Salix suchowensis]
MDPGSCDFSGTASVSKSDPSYGSCMYPSSLSTAGGTGTATGTTPAANPTFQTPPSSGGTAGLNPGTPPLLDNSEAALGFMVSVTLLPLCFLLVHSFTFRPM